MAAFYLILYLIGVVLSIPISSFLVYKDKHYITLCDFNWCLIGAILSWLTFVYFFIGFMCEYGDDIILYGKKYSKDTPQKRLNKLFADISESEKDLDALRKQAEILYKKLYNRELTWNLI